MFTGLNTSQVANQAQLYPGFCSMKRRGVFLLLLERMLVHCRVTTSIKINSAHLYMWVKSGTVRVKCPAQEHNVKTMARAQTELFDEKHDIYWVILP